MMQVARGRRPERIDESDEAAPHGVAKMKLVEITLGVRSERGAHHIADGRPWYARDPVGGQRRGRAFPDLSIVGEQIGLGHGAPERAHRPAFQVGAGRCLASGRGAQIVGQHLCARRPRERAEIVFEGVANEPVTMRDEIASAALQQLAVEDRRDGGVHLGVLRKQDVAADVEGKTLGLHRAAQPAERAGGLPQHAGPPQEMLKRDPADAAAENAHRCRRRCRHRKNRTSMSRRAVQ